MVTRLSLALSVTTITVVTVAAHTCLPALEQFGLQAKLTTSDAASIDFGFSVVSAVFDDNNGFKSGSAYVIIRT
jgi:hypothetical protein